jgi:hypothetical protein
MKISRTEKREYIPLVIVLSNRDEEVAFMGLVDKILRGDYGHFDFSREERTLLNDISNWFTGEVK